MKVQVIGPGCANCQRLYAEAEKAVAQAGLEAELVKVERPEEIESFGVWVTPGLAIDGEVKASGRVPESREIVSWIMTAAANEA
ncbi:MAG: TM0996/MTH895 family glutaredoxin-like protein [Actinobacteria bacterium]|nr:TM0996/MTH895 family glutaredoxin-like protein [Actinomycetota bacterium]MBU1864786.1 TM0996/MTH895 family glutaredoxin-like protein [Actinomycetota bacterium]